MTQIIGAFRLGRDAEVRTTPSGEHVCNLALAFNYGRKNDAGERPTQWVEAALWGKLAQAMQPYLVKGQQVYAALSDPHIEQYEGKNGTGHKLVARVMEIELVGSRPQGEQRQAAAPQPQRNAYADQRGAPQPSRQRPAAADPASDPSGFDMDDDIPF